MESGRPRNKHKLGAVIGLIVIVASIAVGGIAAGKHKTVSATTTVTVASPTATTSATTQTSASATTSEYKDGTYTATGTYDSPGGTEAIKVTVTLADDKVTATSATAGATDPQSQEYQADFISGYKSLVVGKSLDSVHLSKVSGSSLTSTGFNSALSSIKLSARS